MARNTSVNVGVNFVPDTTQLDSALKQFNNVDLQTKVTGISGDVLAPFRQSVEDLNAAMASGRGENEIAQLMDRVKTEANAARASLDAATAGIKAFYDSPVNQNNLKAISEIDAKLESATNQLKQWNKNKSALNELRKMASQSGFDIDTTARGRLKQIKDIEALRDAQGNLNEEFQTQVDLIRQYQTISNELRTTRKGDIESNIRNLTLAREGLLANTVTPEMLTNFTTSAAMTSSQVTSQENDFLNRLPAYTQNLQKIAKASNEARGRVKELGDTFTASFLGFSLSNILEDAARGAQQFFTAYDETLTRTQMVTGMARDEVMSLTSAYAELADELSSTISAVAEAQLVFYQQGLSTEDSLAMTEASIAISKTGGIEAGEAADRLTAAVNGYQLAASDAMDIADKMSALDAAAASSVDELTVAMQKSASQARMAGLDLDYYMAYLSTMQEVTREAPENIGTAMKSITSRIQEITDIGKVEEDGTTFSKVATALNSIGIAALDTQGQLRPLQEILNDLGPMWATLDRNHQAYIATVLAGNRQQSRFIALMDNYDRALELVDISQNSTGESARQLRAYDEGLESSLIGLQNAWQQFATSLVDSDMIKTVVDALTSLIEVVNSIPDGLLRIVAGLAAVSAAYKTISAIKKPEFRAWFNDTGLGRIITAFRGISTTNNEVTGEVERSWRTTTSNIGNFVVTMVNRINQALVGIKSSTGLETEKKQIDALNTSISSNSRIRQQNSLAQIQSNTNSAVEIDTTRQLANEQGILSNNYGTSVENINAQKDAMDKNDPTMKKEISDAQQLSNVQDVPRMMEINQEEINKIRKAQRDAIQNFNKLRLEQRTAYEKFAKDPNSWKPGGELYSMAEQRLASEGVTLPTGQLSLENLDEYNTALNKKMQELYEEAGQGNHHMIEGVLRPAFEKEMELYDAQLKNLLDERSRLGQIRAGIISDAEGGVKSSKVKNKTTPKKTGAEQKAYAKNTLSQFAAQGDYSFGSLKTLFSDKNLTLVNKFRGALSGVNIAGGLMVKTLGQMALSSLGFSDDLSEGLSTTAGLATALSSFGAPGIIAGIAIGGIVTTIDMLVVSAEEAREKLEELNTERDELSQNISNISGALESYTELSNKIDRTEEEQQQLNDSAAQLADLIPDAVIGYDELGNAIINTIKVQTELNAKIREGAELGRATAEYIGHLQNAEDGWGWSRSLLEIFMPGGKSSEEKRQEDRRDVAVEYRADFSDSLEDIIDANKLDVPEGAREVYNTFAEAFRQEAMSDYLLGEKYASQVETEFSDRIKKAVENIDFNDFETDIDSFVSSLRYSDDSFEQATEDLKDRLKEDLKRAGLDDAAIEAVINVILTENVEGYSELTEIKAAIEAEKNNLAEEKDQGIISDNAYKEQIKKLDNLEKQLEGADSTTIALLKQLGLLEFDAVGILNEMGIDKIKEYFTDDKGLIDYNNGLKYQNELLKQRYELRKKEAELKVETGPEAERDYLNSLLDTEEYQLWLEQNGGDREVALGGIKNQFEQAHSIGITEDTFAGSEASKEAYGEWLRRFKTEMPNALEETTNAIEAADDSFDELQQLLSNVKVPSFDEMSDGLNQITEDFNNLDSTLTSIVDKNNRLSSSDLSSVFSFLGDMEEAMENNEISRETWNNSLNEIAAGMRIVNGELVMSDSAMQAMNNLLAEQIRLENEALLANLRQTEAKLENQRSMVRASILLLEQELDNISKMDDAEFESYKQEIDISGKLTTFLSDMDFKSVESTAEKLNNQLDLHEKYYDHLAGMELAFQNGQDYTFKDLEVSDFSERYEESINKTSEEMKKLFTGTREEAMDAIWGELSDLYEVEDYLTSQISDVQIKMKQPQLMLDSNFDAGAFFSEEATDAVDEYNEQLERTLTLLEKIEGIQHKIEENDAFRDLYEGANGTRRGELLAENLRLYEEQFDYYKQLFDMQQEMTNQAAGDLLDSPYGELFTIAENGDIGWATTEMYDKYKGLPDDMQEDIDELVQAFQDQRDALRDTENELLNYANAMKEAREEIVDLIEETEDLILETIKDREEVLHNARIKALEDEIEMIEKAVEARNDAREEQDNAEDLFEAQEALRRATLDSSGKNNATLLQLQQDLEDKQQEISEKRFEDDMDARKEYLQAIIDAENETYDYRLETMTWYWEQVEEMQTQSTEIIMKFLMDWNEEYLKESQFGQERLMEQWQSTFDELNSLMQDEMTDNINDLKNKFLDLAGGVEAIDVNVQALAGSWQKVHDNASKALSVSGSGGGGGPSYFVGNEKDSGELKYYTKYTGKNGLPINKDGLTNGKVDPEKMFGSRDNYGTLYQPNNVGGNRLRATGVMAIEVGIRKNSSGVTVDEQNVFKADGTGKYYIWNGSKGKYEAVTSLIGKYGNNSQYPTGMPGDTSDYALGQAIERFLNNKKYYQGIISSTTGYKYASGGLVDYTGPAWVDGSTANPEAFLSAYQTEQIGALAKALDSSSVNTVSNSSNVTFGTITFNVASMSSAADGRKALDTFVKGANEMMAKKGVNTTLNLNYK